MQRLDPIFSRLAPGIGATSRARPGREKLGGTAEDGYLHCGPSGAGHFVKMVHNGIEYGLMAAYAEGLNILHARQRRQAGRTTSTPRPRRCATPSTTSTTSTCADIAEVWRRGSVDRLVAARPDRRSRSTRIPTSPTSPAASPIPARGAGRIAAAIDEGVPAPVLTAALYERFSSRGEADFADKLLSAMRFQFGGHLEKPDK